jgi:hypothetical protein
VKKKAAGVEAVDGGSVCHLEACPDRLLICPCA